MQTEFISGTVGALWSIEKDATLYLSNKHGQWEQVGPAGNLTGVRGFVAAENALCVLAGDNLFRTCIKGGWAKVGEGGWNTTTLFAVLNVQLSHRCSRQFNEGRQRWRMGQHAPNSSSRWRTVDK